MTPRLTVGGSKTLCDQVRDGRTPSPWIFSLKSVLTLIFGVESERGGRSSLPLLRGSVVLFASYGVAVE